MARDRAARPEASALRLFVAIEPSEEAQAAIDAAVEPWRETFPRARWVTRQNRHLTLKFLGRTWPRLRRLVEDRVLSVASEVPAFATRLEGLGSFPSSRRGRVLWVGLNDAEGRLAALAGALDAALSPEFAPETRAFTPHVTVARSAPPLPLPPSFADATVEPVGFSVTEVVLFRSHLRRPAPIYEPVERFGLGSSG